MKAIGLIGNSGAGKTTLLERLIAHFVQAGLRVAAIKHAHHGFDIDRPGKDSYRYRSAGAAQVLVASDERWALLGSEPALPQTPVPGADAPDSDAALAAEALAQRRQLERHLARLDPCDLVLVEGFRSQGTIACIEVRRVLPDGSAAPQRAPVPGMIAVAADAPTAAQLRLQPGAPVVLDLDDVTSIALFIAAHLEITLC